MANFNQVILMGNLTRDPELTYLPSQVPVVSFGLAVNRKWKKEDGSEGEDVCYLECVMYGKRAEIIQKYFTKGKSIFILGRLKFEQWVADGGGKHSRVKVVVEKFEFLGKGQSS